MNLSRALQLKPGEPRTLALLFGWYFCVIGGTFVARAVRDSLFLAHLGAARLPAMYIATPLVVTLVGVVYARIESRWRRDSIAVATVASGAVLFGGARALLGTGDWIFYALYIATSVIGSLVIMQLWTVASDRFTARDAKRVFGLIGAGGTAADIAVGAAIAVLAPRLGAENLLFVVAGLFGAAAVFAVIARSGARMPVRGRVVAAAENNVPGTSHLKLVGIAVVLAVVVVTLVEFQFKA
ncbi:MAG TPA: Npt1/Npt2 family nucleotide transporter, partial [Kofleriaceae bacterium]